MQLKTFDEMAAAYLTDYSNPRYRKEIFLDMLKEAGVTKYVKKLRKRSTSVWTCNLRFAKCT